MEIYAAVSRGFLDPNVEGILWEERQYSKTDDGKPPLGCEQDFVSTSIAIVARLSHDSVANQLAHHDREVHTGCDRTTNS